MIGTSGFSEIAVNENAKTAKIYAAKKALERLTNQTIKLEDLEPDEIVDTSEAIAFLSHHFKQKMESRVISPKIQMLASNIYCVSKEVR